MQIAGPQGATGPTGPAEPIIIISEDSPDFENVLFRKLQDKYQGQISDEVIRTQLIPALTHKVHERFQQAPGQNVRFQIQSGREPIELAPFGPLQGVTPTFVPSETVIAKPRAAVSDDKAEFWKVYQSGFEAGVAWARQNR